MVQRFEVGARMSELAVHNGVCYLAGQIAHAVVHGHLRHARANFETLNHYFASLWW